MCAPILSGVAVWSRLLCKKVSTLRRRQHRSRISLHVWHSTKRTTAQIELVLSEMEQGRAEARESRVKRTMHDWQPGKISFEKTLGTSAVSTTGTLTLPARLWRRHGDKVQKFVILQPVADRKMWTVEVKVYFPGKRPQVVFCGGWSLFVIDNGLVKGDRLKFTLTGRSKFEVVTLRKGGRDPKVTSVLRAKIMSQDSVSSQRQPKKLVAQQNINVPTESSVKSERELDSMRAKGETAAKDSNISHPASNITCEASSKSPSDMDFHFFEALKIPSDMDSLYFESSEIPSDMDSHFFEPMLQKNQQEDALLKTCIDTGYLTLSLNALPWFCKRIRGSNTLEISCKFLRSHWTHIGTHAQLQGIHETSQVYTVMFTSVVDQGRPRLFFKSSCWNSFLHDNCLRAGQRLVFTLIGLSSFVVRIAE